MKKTPQEFLESLNEEDIFSLSDLVEAVEDNGDAYIDRFAAVKKFKKKKSFLVNLMGTSDTVSSLEPLSRVCLLFTYMLCLFPFPPG